MQGNAFQSNAFQVGANTAAAAQDAPRVTVQGRKDWRAIPAAFLAVNLLCSTLVPVATAPVGKQELGSRQAWRQRISDTSQSSPCALLNYVAPVTSTDVPRVTVQGSKTRSAVVAQQQHNLLTSTLVPVVQAIPPGRPAFPPTPVKSPVWAQQQHNLLTSTLEMVLREGVLQPRQAWKSRTLYESSRGSDVRLLDYVAPPSSTDVPRVSYQAAKRWKWQPLDTSFQPPIWLLDTVPVVVPPEPRAPGLGGWLPQKHFVEHRGKRYRVDSVEEAEQVLSQLVAEEEARAKRIKRDVKKQAKRGNLVVPDVPIIEWPKVDFAPEWAPFYVDLDAANERIRQAYAAVLEAANRAYVAALDEEDVEILLLHG